MMKVYLVVDSYQYDGGVDILSSHLNTGDATTSMEEARKEAGAKAWCNRPGYDKVRAVRIDCIYIQEIEPK